MKITLHGGDCCGVKTIYDLSSYPDTSICARKATKRSSRGQHFSHAVNDMMHRNKYGRYDFFNEAAPKESYKERLKRFVTFIKANRPHGIIEIVLNGIQKKWVPIIKELGFKEVTNATNSNTLMTIYIYHLSY